MKRLAIALCTFSLALLAGACADESSGTACTATWTLDGAGGTDGGSNQTSVEFEYPDIDSVDAAVAQCKDDAEVDPDRPDPAAGQTLHTGCECSTT